MHKLGVIVPFRSRHEQLRTFLKKVPKYLESKGIDYEVIVVEQMDEGDFNRGALLNAGAVAAEQAGCDYFAFHDVDLLPVDVDYSYPEEGPCELVKKVRDTGYSKGFDVSVSDLSYDYFGGVTLFTAEDFRTINGYSNRYTGWGFEDNDLLARCEESGLPLSTKGYRQFQVTQPGLYFNGKDSYVDLNTGIRFNPEKDLSFLVTFRVEDLPFNKSEVSDEATIFSIPGQDLNLAYTNYGTLKFEVFDDYEDSYSIHTSKIPMGVVSQAVIVFKEGEVRFYLNGNLVGSEKVQENHKFRVFSNKLYLGVAHPQRGDKAHWFQGHILDFATFGESLEHRQVQDLFFHSSLGLGNYKPRFWYSAYTLRDRYLPNLGLGYDAVADVFNCTVEAVLSPQPYRQVIVPKNRKGLFEGQSHMSNGYQEGSWKSWCTRLNQRRYREVLEVGSRKSLDGLSTLPKVAKTMIQKLDNYTHVQFYFYKLKK